ncbi:MAG: hypothetical protein IJF18_05230 [Oscillospiraceae bacterium]|nr:hypothetical protein [Oscillospiraceae bacterium]
MLISEYLQMRNVSVTTGNVTGFTTGTARDGNTIQSPENSGFAKELQSQLAEQKKNGQGVEFSRHAMERISERQIDLDSGDTLERLNRAVELAGEKGSSDALVMIDSNAFIVSVKNNKVITTLSANDMQGNIFTNIDSTVIM